MLTRQKTFSGAEVTRKGSLSGQFTHTERIPKTSDAHSRAARPSPLARDGFEDVLKPSRKGPRKPAEPWVLEHWRIAFYRQMIGRFLVRVHKVVSERVQSALKLPLVESGGLTFMLRNQLKNSDTSLSNKSTVLVKEGHIAHSFYFVLSGQVEIYMVKNGSRHRIANIKDPKYIAAKVQQLAEVPVLTISAEFPSSHVSLFEIMQYETNDTIIYEGTETGQIHWIIKGTCKCVKMVPFVQRTVKTGHSSTATSISPYDPNVPLGTDEEIVRRVFTIQELEPGDHFPGLPPFTGTGFGGDFIFKKESYLHQLELADPTSQQNKAEYSVVATSPVEAAVISRLDFVRSGSQEMILAALDSKNLFHIPVQQLQEAYIGKRSWQYFKQKIVSEIIKRK
nr:hypothetical protein HK105_006558 [Polyrhizophydium stewartii]